MLSFEEILKKEIVYKINDIENVNIPKSIVYKSTNKEELLMDLYTPFSNDKKEKLPVVILVHGEAASVNFKETGQYISYGKLLASFGLNAVNFNHKVLAEGFNIKEVISDMDSLINYLVENADKLKIDKNKIAIWCFSGGVPFGLYTGMSNYFDYVKGIIAYYGFGDFTSLGEFLQLNISKEDAKRYSPINLIDENASRIPPLFIARAGLDNQIINESIDEFITKGLKNNLTIDIFNHSTGGHAFDLFNDNDRTHEIIAESLEFLRKHLK
ncbi:dienelactone hydrolase family protein [Clostridium sporogenes]|uniref:alpha/beta hydrolase family protein n=1 Tax=Clostridium sporogenes TaxID=1509 RepID=UPI002237B8BD|nr:dienelactone hydrolase family protein [Clostridium sporogenes]MCW6060194.1 dienelactone hydrolase family protein [Clostridium sporogenes]MCW6068162.1 dienelactone hydrolase family protein [Clostridium sporogenes]MDU1320249.1 dienelactone hydrolase family protein [Clostridium botulinum]